MNFKSTKLGSKMVLTKPELNLLANCLALLGSIASVKGYGEAQAAVEAIQLLQDKLNGTPASQQRTLFDASDAALSE